MIIQKSHVTLGIIGGYYPTTVWHVGPLGDVRWITSDRKFPPGMNNCNCWLDSSRGVPSEPVQVILIMGPFDRLPTERWNCPILQVVLSLTQRDRCKKRQRWSHPGFGGGNFELLKESLCHCDCGGVTDARCVLRTMIKQGSNYRWGLPNTIANVLGNALDDTVGRGKPVDLPELGQINTSRGLLRWKER